MSKLSLHHDSCGFYGMRVRRALTATGVYAELRDIRQHPHWREELVRARGRAAVPVLRIEDDDGRVQWMAESKDIVRHLKALPSRREQQHL